MLRGGTSFANYIRLMKIPLLFIIMSTISIILNISPIPLSFIALPFGKYYITVSQDSLLFACQLLLTALGSVSCLYFLSLSTPMTDFLMVLKRVRCPFLLIELMLLIYRFIFVLLDFSSSLSISQKSRLGNKDFKTSCYSIGNLMAVLLVRSLQKSSYLYDAMESRCYDGKILLLTDTSPIKKEELVFVAVFELILIAIAVLISRDNILQ